MLQNMYGNSPLCSFQIINGDAFQIIDGDVPKNAMQVTSASKPMFALSASSSRPHGKRALYEGKLLTICPGKHGFGWI